MTSYDLPVRQFLSTSMLGGSELFMSCLSSPDQATHARSRTVTHGQRSSPKEPTTAKSIESSKKQRLKLGDR